MKIFQKIKFKNYSEFRLLNIPVFGIEKNIENKKIKLYFLPINKLRKILLEGIISIVGNKFDDVIFIRSGLGELYLINFFIDDLIKKYDLKNVCYANFRNINCNWQCYNKLPFIMLPEEFYIARDILKKNIYTINGKKVLVYFPRLEMDKIVKKHSISTEHHVDSVLKFYGLSRKNISKISNNITKDDKQKSLDFLKSKNINIDNFIFISKYANSMETISEDFWNDLKGEIEKQNYDVVFNTKEISISQATYIASLSKGIIGVRSGFMEGLSITNDKKLFVLYKDLKSVKLVADKFIDTYSLKKYPFVCEENIFEYNANKNTKNQIIADIITKLDSILTPQTLVAVERE